LAGNAGRNYGKLAGKKPIRKRWRRIVRWTIVAIGTLLFLVVVVMILLLYPVVQTWIAGIVGRKLSEDLGFTIRIERVELRPFALNRLHGVYIGDLRGDTLIAVDELRIRGLKLDTKGHVVKARRVELYDARFNLAKAPGDAHSNLTNLIEKLASADTSSGGAPWTVVCGEFDIQRFRFKFTDHNEDLSPFGVDFDHVDVNTADIRGTDLHVAGDSIMAFLEQVSFHERSGLVVDELSGLTHVSPRGITIEGMRLCTPESWLLGDLKFTTDSWADHDDFITNVRMRLVLGESRLQFADIAWFATDLQGIDLPIDLSGNFRGTVNELKGRGVSIRFGEGTAFSGNAELTGLPDFQNTFMVVDVDHVETVPDDLARIPMPPFTEGRRLRLPEEVTRMGRMSFRGNFTGFPRAFTASGSGTTEAGPLVTDITYERDTISNIFQLRGRVATTGFALGQVLGDPTVGNIACDVNVRGAGTSLAGMTAELEGTVPQLHVQKLNVGGITLKGRLEKNLFNGVLHADDPHLKLDFDGLADLRGKWPKVDFTADIAHLDPRSFGLIGGEGYSGLSMRVEAHGELAPDSLKGSIDLWDVNYCQDSVDIDIGDISLTSGREQGQPVLTLRSTLADADIRGPFFPTRLPDAFRSVIFSVFPALQAETRYKQEEQRFSFDATIKRAQPVLDLVAPGLILAEGARASGSFDSRTFNFGLNAALPHIAYGAFSADSVEVILDKAMDLLAFRFRGARQAVGNGSFISGIELTGTAYQDEVRLRAGWEASDNGTSGDLDIDALVLNAHSMAIDLRPSTLYFGRGNWTNERTAHLLLDSTSIRVDSLELRNGDQYALLDGAISENPASPLRFDLRGVRLENARPFYQGPEIRGTLRGDGSAFNLYKAPYVLSDLCVDSLAIEDNLIGDLRTRASWNNDGNTIGLGGELLRDSARVLGFTGTLAPGKKEELDADLDFDHLDLTALNPYLPDAISDVQGHATGRVEATGKLAEPQLNGELMLDDAGLRINYLNTRYSFSHLVQIRPDQFFMDGVDIHDEQGGWAHGSPSINHRSFARWDINVGAEMHDLLVLNTTLAHNQLFYGSAVASGMLNIDGYAENLGIEVTARTEPGTSIHLPLGASMDVSGLPFVRFVGAGENADSLQAPVDLTGVHLDMNIEVTPDAGLELIFDPTVGDIIRGRGRGNVAMSVTPSGDLSMRGRMEIIEGDYLFTLRNLVNKRFSVDPGGTINWYGDPFDARVDLNAVYKLRTALYDIMPPGERTEAYRKRVPVEVTMQLTDKLMQPEIGFGVRLPSVDEGVRTRVNTVLSDKDRLNRQVFALIVLNKFIAEDAGAGGLGVSAGASGSSTMAEFASSQLSNIIGRITDDVDLGVNYRPGNSIASDEFEVAVGKAFFNNRVQLSTNVGVAGPNNASAGGGAQFIGDFNLEYRITNDGKLRAKAFSQSNDRNLNQLNQAQTTQGAGLAWSGEFNRINFLRRWWRKLTGTEREGQEGK